MDGEDNFVFYGIDGFSLVLFGAKASDSSIGVECQLFCGVKRNEKVDT